MKKVMIAMSGGVDSSATALILQEQGYEVVGGMLSLHDAKDVQMADGCCTTADVLDAKAVCEKLGMEFSLFTQREDFREKVIDKFVKTYQQGGTPNPCVDCNRDVKFKIMLEKMEEKGCDFLATGHYAKVEKDETTGRYLLKKADNLAKDQSYVLYSLTQKQLGKILFPLGTLEKSFVREKACKAGLDVGEKKDSQDICFVPDGDYVSFIEKYTGKTFSPGDFVDRNGKILGRHKGIIGYTIGQRKGLGLALEAPMYVIFKDVEKNNVVLGSNEDLFTKEVNADNVNLISIDKIDGELRCKAKLRYKQMEQWATVYPTGDTSIQIIFDEPQRAVAKGQAVVLYDGDVVIGGGTII